MPRATEAYTASNTRLLVMSRAAFMDLPATSFEACDQRPGRVSSQALVRYRNNDYSVPVAYAHREIIVKGYVDEVVIP